jgi:D-inositol-3-phosphate glycosyltransferase
VKIVLISPAHPLRGGIAASSERLAQALQAAGHDVVVYSFRVQYPDFLFPGKTQYTSDPAPAGIRIVTMLHSLHPFNWIRTARAIVREQPDRVIIRFWMPFMGPALGTVARMVRWWSRRPVHVTALVDNIIPHEKRMGDRWLARYFVAACHDFVVMSKSVGIEIGGFLPNNTPPQRIRFAPHPIYDTYGSALPRAEARTALNLPPNAPIVLFFGLIRPYKGLDLLLKALSDPRCAAIHLVVAGECYEDWATYQNLIAQNNLNDRVHLFLDYIPNEAVSTYFSATDLLVQPYKTATQSGVLQVAYHFEQPVIVTNVGGLPEMVEPGVSGWIVPPNDPAALATCMADFFAHDRSDMAERVRSIKSRFSWDNLVAALLG